MIKIITFILISLFITFVFATVTVASTGGRPLSSGLTGAEEVPGPGDPDGSGSADLTLNHGQNKICYVIEVSGINLPASGAHIHVGHSGTEGAVVVPLSPPNENGTSEGCIDDVDRELIKNIRLNPENYYVNVHTSDYPDGALRGQLGK